MVSAFTLSSISFVILPASSVSLSILVLVSFAILSASSVSLFILVLVSFARLLLTVFISSTRNLDSAVIKFTTLVISPLLAVTSLLIFVCKTLSWVVLSDISLLIRAPKSTYFWVIVSVGVLVNPSPIIALIALSPSILLLASVSTLDCTVSIRLLKALSELSRFLISAFKPSLRSFSDVVALLISASIFWSSSFSLSTARLCSVVKARLIASLTPLTLTPF